MMDFFSLTQVNGDFGRHSLALQELNFNSFPSDSSANYFIGKSPFPLLDKFIESVASVGTVSGDCYCFILR